MTASLPSAPLRSLLFVPADDARRVAKALAGSADAVVLDLEDAVAQSRKAAARDSAAQTIDSHRGELAIYVRVNGAMTAWCLADLEAVALANLAGILLPKAQSAQEVASAAWAIEQLEMRRRLRKGAIDLVPLIESAQGLLALESICRATRRVRRIAFGAADFTADLGIEWTAGEAELDAPRRALVTVSRASGLEAPLDSPVLEFRDADRMLSAAQRSRALGFQGKLCIHPAQIDPCHRAFAPSPAELERAERIVAAFESAEREGIAAIEVDGALVDYAVAIRARRLLAAQRRT